MWEHALFEWAAFRGKLERVRPGLDGPEFSACVAINKHQRTLADTREEEAREVNDPVSFLRAGRALENCITRVSVAESMMYLDQWRLLPLVRD